MDAMRPIVGQWYRGGTNELFEVVAIDEEDQTIVRSIVELGHRLGYRVTAEGVEDERAFHFLERIGCNHAQGYFISKAVAAGEFDAFVAGGRWPVADYKMEPV